MKTKLTLADVGDVLSPEELMAVLGLGRNKVYDLLRMGEIPSLRFGRRIVIPKRHVETLLDAAGGE